MSEKNLDNNDISLAVLGLLTSSSVAVTISDGDFTYFTTGAGLILFCISQSFLPRLRLNGYGVVAFALIQSAALLEIVGKPFDSFTLATGLCRLDAKGDIACLTDAALGKYSIYALAWAALFVVSYIYVRRQLARRRSDA
jgi:hypothetical protein